jgi:hypothetical protein
VELWSAKVAADGGAAAGDLSPGALLGAAAANGPAALAACQQAFMAELWADTLGFVGEAGLGEVVLKQWLYKAHFVVVSLALFCLLQQLEIYLPCASDSLASCSLVALSRRVGAYSCCCCILPAGAFIVRRLVGIAHTADMDSIADADVRAACELRALRFGRHLLVQGAATYKDVRQLTAAAAAARQVDGLPADTAAANTAAAAAQ